jgi:H+/Na+-translocating ferredoxin:NAD+ oxidoreductase subunit D
MIAEQMALDSSPHLHSGPSTPRIMWSIAASLVPTAAWGVWLFGLHALAVLAAAVFGSLAGEAFVGMLRRRSTLWDGSAAANGLLIGCLMPPGVPVYVPIAASLFAMIVVKGSFGGLGANWMNPAAAGQAFAFISWPAGMSAWGQIQLSLRSSAGHALPPLSAYVAAPSQTSLAARGAPMQVLSVLHYPTTNIGGSAAKWLSGIIHSAVNPLGFDLLLGTETGWIGSVSLLLVVAGGVFLIASGLVGWRIPVAYAASFVIALWCLGWIHEGTLFQGGAVLFHAATGGFLFGALFLANEPTASPLTKGGAVGYGVGLGVVTALLRIFGHAEESVVFAVLLMNILVPLINLAAERRRGGERSS